MTGGRGAILVVDDSAAEREALARVLRLEKYDVLTAKNPADALILIDRQVDLIVSDLRMGRESGIDLLREWARRRPDTPFLLLTAFGTVDTAVEAMKLGARDFLTKPVDPELLLELVRRALGGEAPATPGDEVVRQINAGFARGRIVGRSRALVDVCAQTLRVAPAASTVLILGESGTGKELIAEALHRHGPRHAGPFVVVNMAAIPESLVESELFGHVKGAFTHAIAERVGLFGAAQGGTLFIDEVGDFPLHLQAKLLRALEARVVCPVGSSAEVPVDVRFVAATSRPLVQMKKAGTFREELYYRLNVIPIHVPPLRQRRPDVPLLARHFLDAFAAAAGRRAPRLEPELARALEELDWPGNVRQLRNCVERMSVLSGADVLTLADLPPDVRETDDAATGAGARLESLTRSAILQALEQFDGNRTRAADFLGISVRTLQRKLRIWG